MTRRSRDPSASNTTDAAEQDQGPCPGGHLGTLHRSCVPPGAAVSISKAPNRAARCRRGDVRAGLHALRGHPRTHADLTPRLPRLAGRRTREAADEKSRHARRDPDSAVRHIPAGAHATVCRRRVPRGTAREAERERQAARRRQSGSEPVVGPPARLRVRETIARAHCPVAVIHPRTSSRPAISRAGDVPIQDTIRREFR